MDCSTLASAASATPDATGAPAAPAGCSAEARLFEDALNRPDGGDIYVDGQHAASAGNPLVGMMNTFDSLKLTPEAGHRAGRTEHVERTDSSFDEQQADAQDAHEDQFNEFSDVLLGVQSQILRATLMMETVNSAKQGVTTLFQQQG